MKKTIIILATTLILSGCIFAPRDSGRAHGYSEPPTIGKQLLDLNKARETGVINNEEFERTKARILDGRI